MFFLEFVSGLSCIVTTHDLTGSEASTNSFHIEDYMPREADRDPAALARVAVSCARFLAWRLRAFSDATYRVIMSVRDRTSTLRFHTLRDGESWLTSDLDGYDEAVGYLDSTDPDLGH